MYQCNTFKSLSAEQRKNFVKTQCCCFNCLAQEHFPKKCPSRGRCARCQGKYHTLIHGTNNFANNEDKSEIKSEHAKAEASTTNSLVSETKSLHTLKVLSSNKTRSSPYILLATARVLIRSEEGRSLKLRALIDSGSEAIFKTERAAQLLRSKRKKTSVRVSGLGGCNNIANYYTSINIYSCSGESSLMSVRALILPNIISLTELPNVNLSSLSHINDLQLADSETLS